jgi:energy-converting hydrogenase Eha subunit E
MQNELRVHVIVVLVLIGAITAMIGPARSSDSRSAPPVAAQAGR